jgi:site-specific DNA-methyltransferase (adenine-specific)
MTSPLHITESVTLYQGDCRDILPALGSAGTIVSDVPYGIAFQRGDGGTSLSKVKRRSNPLIIGDQAPFDPTHLLHRPCILFGANHFYARLPDGGTFHTWDKSRGVGPADDFSDAEYVWTSWRQKSEVIRYLWKGLLQDGEKGLPKYHIAQKPIAVMQWCIAMVREPGPILDPYMGSGSTGVAAIRMGRPFVGIELDPGHFATAARRIAEAAQAGPDLFRPAAAPLAAPPPDLFGDCRTKSIDP